MNDIKCMRTDCALQYNTEGWSWGRCAHREPLIEKDGKCASFEQREQPLRENKTEHMKCPKCGGELPDDLNDYILWRCKCGYVTLQEKVR